MDCQGKMKLLALFFLVATSSVMAGNETPSIKTLVFPSASANSYVEMVPSKPLNMKAFTLCMRVATELTGSREVILFAYRTKDYDELNVWREEDGRLSLYLRSSSEAVMFKVPELRALMTHLCVAWNSETGATTLYLDGLRSLTKIYKKGHTVQAGGKVLIGQDPDSYVGRFDSDQSFVGEISDVDMWDYVLSDSSIQNMAYWKRTSRSLGGNVLNWATAKLEYHGNVHVVYHRL
ncbi:C-reactive protein-like [Halichoeres trimaculatus]|uniref:C-reactive protein-like n=1 Tax=Halichoeres trimaculatus TaxID=147232 RepID=UPI003D9DF373